MAQAHSHHTISKRNHAVVLAALANARVQGDAIAVAHYEAEARRTRDYMRSERYRHPAPKFLVSRCYTTITPESAEIGDFDDNGYVFEDRFMTLRELVEELQDCTEVSSMPLTRETSGSAWAMTGYSIEDYETMEERQESVHFRNLDGSSVDADRAWRVFVLANLATP